MIVAISFTSESTDRYLSLLTEVGSAEEVADIVEMEYGDEFPFLYIDQVATDNGTEQEVMDAVQLRIEKAQEVYND